MATSLTSDRHIVMVGATGSGKSTVGNHIMKSKVFPVKSDVESVTIQTTHTTGTINYKDSSYNIVLMEAPGLFNTKIKSDKSVLDDVNLSIKMNCPNGLNLVLFIVKEGCRATEMAKVFQCVKHDLLGTIEDISALVITCCENKSTVARENVVKRIHDSESTNEIAKFMKKGIYTVGFPDLNEVYEEDVSKLEEKMKKDEQKLLQLIAEAEIKSHK